MSSNSTPRLRCAVYTRKSSEEGLDQEFNSLDAQREACVAYIASQVGLGWKLVPDRYDDGGISGGTMERPALQRLLQDIRDKKVDVVVVYKIDRLTRSLMDFSKIVEIFDASSASFVSVTQQFNTTTSMGRLTLNVLLSFAQFEREVTAERIRDKIAASKKKGMWMGGVVPLGYRVEHRKLVIDDAEAKIVRHIFDRYLVLKSVRDLADEAARDGLVTRTRERQDGSVAVTTPFGRGNLYHLLSNPIYIGKIKHKDQAHDGEHEPIIAGPLFEEAQALLASQAPRRRSTSNVKQPHLLTGMLFDEHGEKLRSVHASKSGVRYRYYVSKQFIDQRRGSSDGWRLPADAVESVVEHQLNRILSDHSQIADLIQRWGSAAEIQNAMRRAAEFKTAWTSDTADHKRSLLQKLVRRVGLGQKTLAIDIDGRALSEHLLDRALPSDGGGAETLSITCPFDVKRRGVEMRIVLADASTNGAEPDAALIDVVHRSQLYLHQLTDGCGRSLTGIASLNETTVSEVSRLLPMAFLSPKIVSKIIAGNQPVELTAHRLSRLSGLPLAWSDQSALLGL
ncbi:MULTISPECIES: recombinase family protein [unclassified Mesorhizobium]|uniref:recombinase family protein n=1 Tax=unclassified Mesorhizobium TaxID=325217 RepID=UPI000FE7B29A|nr:MULTISPECIES: recombinase family protein [unclassified Mesorhizobium]RWB73233.1 MAG: recombinase family protein [Mesorhizobium sp.]RWB90847.1 MAG: recombinase family protein [Mesorhizobium sp.]TGS64053.1 recombinase family protein [Mesorhizobium sp. M3A.F.Ca.ET.201.01.1.1]